MGHGIQDPDRRTRPTAAPTVASCARFAAVWGVGKSARFLLLLAACALSACVTNPETDSADWLGPDAKGSLVGVPRIARKAVSVALQMKGVPYVWGGTTPAGFDCSGLIYYSYAKAGLHVPRNSQAQFAAAAKISPETARPGDLLFFIDNHKWHVALYLGRDKFIHAPWPGSTVSVASLRDDFYRSKLVGVGRLISD
jgi:cell wall-associated NlpC family hydrolase